MNDDPELVEVKRKANTRSLKEMARLLRSLLHYFCSSKLTFKFQYLIAQGIFCLFVGGFAFDVCFLYN